jgi:predicted amidophosphoribosyltransferase
MSVSNQRLKPEEHMKNIIIDTSVKLPVSNGIILIDDVLVTGAQFKAAKYKIKEKYQDIEVFGIFIARRVLVDI